MQNDLLDQIIGEANTANQVRAMMATTTPGRTALEGAPTTPCAPAGTFDGGEQALCTFCGQPDHPDIPHTAVRRPRGGFYYLCSACMQSEFGDERDCEDAS